MIEEFVKLYGERHRPLIENAIRFLDDREPHWGLDTPVDRHAYIKLLVEYDSQSDA